jgi:hypothetical protein
MMIGRIAESFLSSKQLKNYENILGSGQFPRQTITECSTWHDDLKDVYKLYTMGNWHFADGPFVNTTNESAISIPPETYNVSTYLDSAWRSLMNPTTTDPWIWSFHIRGIVHFVGDIHTPHHNCALFNEDFPTGDAGGNGYKLNCPYGSACNNIHFIWDAVGFYCSLTNPLIQKYKDEFQVNVTKLMEELPESSRKEDLTTYSPSKWNNESLDIAKKYGYATPMNDWPSEDYLEIVRTQGKDRVVLAGYRLGHILKTLADKMPNISESHGREIGMWILNVILAIVSTLFLFLNKKKHLLYDVL